MCFGISAIAVATAPQFASGVSLVEVYATVLDSTGAPVSGLAATDFVVEEDGRPQPVQAFSAGDFPLSLAVAIDRSFSVPQARLTEVVYAAQHLLGELRADDRVMLLAVGSEVDTLSPLSNDHRAAYDALRGLRPWGTTPLFDATLSAIDTIQNAAGRRALILITDGNDRYSRATESRMLQEARMRDVLVYPVVLARAAPSALVELATVTGGRSVAVADPRSLSASLSAIASELRHQYLLGYTPPAHDRPGWHSIAVRVQRRGLTVRAREGYDAAR